jgi:hypothetical protein
MYGGGAERTLLELLKALDPNKYDVTLLLKYYKGIYLDQIPHYVKVRYIFKESNNRFIGRLIDSIKYRFWYRVIVKNLSLVHRLILRDKYDFEISFTEGFPLSFLAIPTEAHKIARLCTNFAHKYDLNTNLDRINVYGYDFVQPIRIADTIWCISNEQSNMLFKYFPDCQSKTKVFHNFRIMDQVINYLYYHQIMRVLQMLLLKLWFWRCLLLQLAVIQDLKRFYVTVNMASLLQ